MVRKEAHGLRGARACSRAQHDNEMIEHIVALLRARVHVAVVTAAGYPGHAERFEQRVEGLLAAFRSLRLPAEVTDRRALCSVSRP